MTPSFVDFVRRECSRGVQPQYRDQARKRGNLGRAGGSRVKSSAHGCVTHVMSTSVR